MNDPNTSIPTNVCLVLNPRAAQDDLLRELIDTMRKEGHGLHVRTIWEHGDVRRVIEQMYAQGVRLFILAGGDGTLHEALQVQCACKEDTFAIGALPYGTGNDFVRTIYSQQAVQHAPHLILRALITGKVIDVDMGCMNNKMFINAVSIGHGAEATDSTPRPIKDMLGNKAYTLWGIAMLNSLEPFTYEFATTDAQHSGEAWLIVVGNGCFVGGGFQACPRAALQDGLLDIVVVPKMGAYNTARAMGLLISQGRHLDHEQLIYEQSSKITLKVDKGMSINADGESKTEHYMNFAINDVPARWLVPHGWHPTPQDV